jgi:signal transduction histidine kinase
VRIPPGAIGPKRVAAVALAAFLTLLSLLYFGRYLLKPYTGLVVNFPEAVSEDGKVLFAPRSPLSPAVRAGLLPYRDRILRVGDRAVATLRDLVAADLAWRTWEPAAIGVLRDGAVPLAITLAPDLPLRRVENSFTLAFLVALIGLGFALLLDRRLSLPTVLLAAACFCYALFVAVKPFYYESLLSNGLVHAGKLAPWLLLGFGLYYPAPRLARPARVAAIAVAAAAFAAFAAGRLTLFADWAATGAEGALVRYRGLGRLANAAEAGAYVAFVGLLATVLRRAGARERARVQWMLAGFLVALPPYFFFDQLPMILDDWGAPRIGTGGFASLFLLPLPVLFTVGFVTSRSIETRHLLSRFLVYAFIALAAVVFFAWLYDPLVEQLTSHYAMSGRAASLVAAFLLAAFLLPAQAMLLRAASLRLDRPVRRVHELARENADLRIALQDSVGREQWETAAQRDLVRLSRHVEAEVDAVRRETDAATSALAEPGGSGAAAALLRAARTHAARLVEAIRPLAALGGGLPERCEADRLAAVAVARARQRFPGIRVEDLTPAVAVRAVPQYVIAALEELLANAYESAPDDLIAIAGRREPGRLRIEVSDRGAGFAPEIATTAMGPFATNKSGHAGMGLYLARRAVALSGGELGIAPKKGGVVWLTLPRA